MSRNINDLVPWFSIKVKAFISALDTAKIEHRVVSTFRRNDVQEALFAVGRRILTKQEETVLRVEGLYPESQDKPITNAATSLSSAHGWALAFDIELMKNGIGWKNVPKEVWQEVYKVAEACGLDALGDPWGEYVPGDLGHFQEPGWRIYANKEEARTQ